MILAAVLGFAVQSWTHWKEAGWIGLLIGFLVAPLIPAKTACSSSEVDGQDRVGQP